LTKAEKQYVTFVKPLGKLMIVGGASLIILAPFFLYSEFQDTLPESNIVAVFIANIPIGIITAILGWGLLKKSRRIWKWFKLFIAAYAVWGFSVPFLAEPFGSTRDNIIASCGMGIMAVAVSLGLYYGCRPVFIESGKVEEVISK